MVRSRYSDYSDYGNYTGGYGVYNGPVGPGGTRGPQKKKKSSCLPGCLISLAVVIAAVLLIVHFAGPAVTKLLSPTPDTAAAHFREQAEESSAAQTPEPAETNEPAAPDGNTAAAAVKPTPTPEPGPYDNDLYWYYAQLTSGEKVVYAEFVDAVSQAAESFEPSEQLTVDEANEVAQAVYGDHPELFWWECGNTCWYVDDTVTRIELEYVFSAEELPAAKAEFEAAAEGILSQMSGLADYEQERIAHDELCRTITYEYGPHNQTAYGALVDGECVCSGYARAMQYLMMQAGVPCYYADGEGYGGEADNKSWGSHAWNVIELQGAFYNLDVTYDDRDDWGDALSWDEDWGYDFSDIYCGYEYYNLPDSEFSLTHIRADDVADMPACTETACSYENLYGESGTCGMLRQMGLTYWEVVSSLEDYYSKAGSELAAAGPGTWRLDFLVEGEEVMQEINEAHDSGSFWDGLAPYVSMQSASASIWSLETGDGEYFMSLLITME